MQVKKTYNGGQFNRKRPPLREEYAHKINTLITAKEVRVVIEGEDPRVMPIDQAVALARSMEKDLVEIAPNVTPPVCKIVDYKKFLYEQKKKQKEIKSNSARVVLKEIRFGPQTDEHDYNFKLKHAESFIQEGAKVKAFVFFKGRSIMFQNQGMSILTKMIKDLEDIASVEEMPKLEGKRLFMILVPKKKK